MDNLDRQMAKLSKRMASLVKTHKEFSRFMSGFLKEQSEINQFLRENLRVLTIAQARRDERLSNLKRGSS